MGGQGFVRVTVVGIIALGVGALILAALADVFELKADELRREQWLDVLRRLNERDRQRSP